ncbi:MAG TPA: hypothetical protein PLX33_09835 [Alphaproteobacteria bacterium]|nr:hypothetical protein [Alphaproteobacteria bacterium]
MTDSEFGILVLLTAALSFWVVHLASRIYARGVQRGIDLALDNLSKSNIYLDLLYNNGKFMVEIRRSSAPPVQPTVKEGS